MLRLDLDCLTEIFKLLDLSDQLNLTRVCKHFEFVIVDLVILPRFGKTDLKIDSDDCRLDDLSLIDYKHFFKLISAYIRHFFIFEDNTSAFSSYLERYGHRPSLEFYLSLNYDSLITLECRDFSLNDGHVRQLADSCKQLRDLTLKSQYVTGLHIEEFRFVEWLHFFNCNLQERPLQRILNQLPLAYLELINNATDVTHVLVDAQLKSIRTIEITDPNFGLYYAAKPSLRFLVVYDYPENILPESEASIAEEELMEGEHAAAEPVEEQAVERQLAEEEQPVERQIAEGNPMYGVPMEAEPIEGQAIERYQPVVGAPADERRQPVQRLRLYPHLTVLFVNRVKFIDAPRDYDIFESLARILTQMELPSTNPPNLIAAIEVVKLCKKLKILKLKLNNFNCDNLEQLTEVCVSGRRYLRVCFFYNIDRKRDAFKKIKLWRSTSSLYKSQNYITVAFSEFPVPRPKYSFNFKFLVADQH